MQSLHQTNSLEDGLSKLNKLNDQMQGLVFVHQHLFRSYIGCYVEGHTICDDYFSALCQHAIINRLFGQAGKHVPIVSLLEIFHLLLANTNEQDKLVFLFSQSILHEFLFEKIDITTESIDSIEYYVQLLKTIVRKLSNGNNSLIKLFCNNRYPSFPLLTAIVTLATFFQKEELVKVTAQQCLLELTGIINQKQIGRGYLIDLQMSVFFYELGWTIRQKLNSDEEGQLKYLADLLFSLRNNQTSLSFLLSSFTNIVLLPLLSDLPILLRVLRVLTEQLQGHGQFPVKTLKSFRKVILNIITTFYFAKFTNSSYMTTMKLLYSSKQAQPNLSKYYLKRGDKVGDFLLQFDSREPKEQQREKYVIFESWVHFNTSSQQVQKIKQGKHKQRSSFLSTIFSKPDIQQEYIKVVLTSIGLNYEALRFPLFKLAATLNYKTGLFIVEEALTKREQRGELINRQQLDAHINQTKGQFQLSEESCKQILKMIKRLQTKGFIITEESHVCPPEVQFQLGFLLKFRTYLLNTLSDYFLVAESDPSLLMIAYWTRTLFKLGVPHLLDRKVKQKLVWKLEQVQQEINDLTFANDFRNLISYITNKKQKMFLNIEGDGEQPLSPSPKNLIQVKTFKYQFLRKLIDPSHVSLSDYVNQHWCLTFTEQQLKQLYTVIIVSPNLTIQVKITQLGICLNIIQQQLQLLIKIEQSDPKIQSSNSCKLIFRNYKQELLVRNKQQAFEIRNSIERIRSLRQQKMTKLIVQYFQITYNKIRDKILQRIK